MARAEEERREAREAVFALNRKRAEARLLRQEKAAEVEKLAAEREAWQREQQSAAPTRGASASGRRAGRARC